MRMKYTCTLHIWGMLEIIFKGMCTTLGPGESVGYIRQKFLLGVNSIIIFDLLQLLNTEKDHVSYFSMKVYWMCRLLNTTSNLKITFWFISQNVDDKLVGHVDSCSELRLKCNAICIVYICRDGDKNECILNMHKGGVLI